ncbi:MAG: hypothetical protein KTR24_08490 [Saprospiraceae bacterium]|nr:hypothetical protein [Saprospiraceae bacterium]
MHSLWNSISTLGVGALPPRQRRRMIFSNRLFAISLLGAVTFLSYSLITKASPVYNLALSCLVLILSTALLLNASGRHIVAIYVAAFGLSLEFTFTMLHSAGFFSQSILYASIAVVSFILLESHELHKRIVLYGTSLLFIVAQLINLHFPPLFELADVPYDELVVFALCMLFIVWVLHIYKSENDALIRQLRKNNRKLKGVSEELERFAYIASHDLKSPLRTVNSFIGLLEKDIQNGKTDRIQSNIDYVKFGVSQMAHIIDDVLALSGIDTQDKQDLAPVDLKEVIDKVCYNLSDEIKRKRALIQVNEELPVMDGNELELMQVFQNLIQNALKYNESNKPEIKISYQQTASEHLLFFRDNGIGIEEQYFDKIFQFFSRLHPSSRYPGTGLGLALCKKIIEKNHGTIVVTSDVGEGSTFTIALPKKVEDPLDFSEVVESVNA